MKKTKNVFSFGLKKTDSNIIREFIENQTNFSETIRYLIYSYIAENNSTEDISYKFNEMLYNSTIRKTNSNNSNVNQVNNLENLQVENEVIKNTVNDNKENINEVNINSTIPSCYE